MDKDKSEKKPWGLLAVINLYDVDAELIKDVNTIKKFTKELCELIKMKRHGPTYIDRFGKGDLEGYSMMQFIETSSIIAHFDEVENRAFIDIFSCKEFDAELALNFCIKFFKANNSKLKIIKRN